LPTMETRENTNRNLMKHVPRRTCIACRKVQDKKDLVRLVCTADGNIEADIKGKKTGRGAYLCRTVECWEEGFRENRLEHAFKAGIGQENKDRLLNWIRDYLVGTDKKVEHSEENGKLV
jgi:uncharacterized protein